ncbi:response regulator [Mucilaginibacter sp. RT5R15]|nr:response regulator [Mucilaginibacter flavidus]
MDRLKAIVTAGENLPEVILLDLNMPVMDGWEFLDEFTKVPPAKKIIIYIVTSSIDPADVEKAKQYEAISQYIVKPVTVDNLKEILNNF